MIKIPRLARNFVTTLNKFSFAERCGSNVLQAELISLALLRCRQYYAKAVSDWRNNTRSFLRKRERVFYIIDTTYILTNNAICYLFKMVVDRLLLASSGLVEARGRRCRGTTRGAKWSWALMAEVSLVRRPQCWGPEPCWRHATGVHWAALSRCPRPGQFDWESTQLL